jgi:hypothetical protein
LASVSTKTESIALTGVAGSCAALAVATAGVRSNPTPIHARNAAPPNASGTRAATMDETTADTPSAPMAPYNASASAAPRPLAKPMARPCASVRWMHSRPMGPTGAAMERPMTRDLSKSVESMRKIVLGPCAVENGATKAERLIGLKSEVHLQPAP